jgi:hypothetical protein
MLMTGTLCERRFFEAGLMLGGSGHGPGCGPGLPSPAAKHPGLKRRLLSRLEPEAKEIGPLKYKEFRWV